MQGGGFNPLERLFRARGTSAVQTSATSPAVQRETRFALPSTMRSMRFIGLPLTSPERVARASAHGSPRKRLLLDPPAMLIGAQRHLRLIALQPDSRSRPGHVFRHGHADSTEDQPDDDRDETEKTEDGI